MPTKPRGSRTFAWDVDFYSKNVYTSYKYATILLGEIKTADRRERPGVGHPPPFQPVTSISTVQTDH
jgi:hypothetical protein